MSEGLDSLERERLLAEIAQVSRRLGELNDELDRLDRRDGLFDDDLADEPTRVMDSYPAPSASPREAATVVEGAAAAGQAARRVDARVPSLRPPPPAFGESEFDRRYVSGELLGEGGMGEVRVFTDRRIGRDVAMKVLLPDNSKVPGLRERFLFEARVQGQLEHPAIVPVYDLGVRPDGLEYFTMKRVLGQTLHQVLKDLRRGDKATIAQFSRRRLLTAFGNVCLAVEYAHQRGVVHRDIKPANVMLGAFGEVSLLDWGVAKLLPREPPVTPTPAAARALEEVHSETQLGEILGTPGYMAPEQAAGSTEVGTACDVFALGAMLYEILTLQKLVPGSSDREVRENTLHGRYDASISSRFPGLDVPRQLEEVVTRATAFDAARRMTARELYEEIEKYLEGEVDMRRRRSLSRRHTREAIAALAEADEKGGSEMAKAARARALREATRALALDPDNQTAVRALMRVMTQVPAASSPEAEAAIEEMEARARRKSAARGSIAYLGVAATMAVSALLGVKSWTVLGLTLAAFLASAAIARWASTLERPNPLLALPIVVLSSIGFALSSSLFGPFAIASTLCALNAVCFSVAMGPPIRRHAIVWSVAAILVPVIAQATGIVPASWVFEDGCVKILPLVVDLPAVPTTLYLSLVAVGAILVPALLVSAERDARLAAERSLALQAQQLAELLPPEAKGTMRDETVGSLAMGGTTLSRSEPA